MSAATSPSPCALSPSNKFRQHPFYEATPETDGLYHCPFENDPKANCTYKPDKLKCNYDKHLDSHLKPFKCFIAGCEKYSFSSKASLLRHEREAHAKHGHGDKPFLCTYEGCERGVLGSGFPRCWNLNDHMKRVHNVSPAPAPTRKRKASEISTPARKKSETRSSEAEQDSLGAWKEEDIFWIAPCENQTQQTMSAYDYAAENQLAHFVEAEIPIMQTMCSNPLAPTDWKLWDNWDFWISGCLSEGSQERGPGDNVYSTSPDNFNSFESFNQ